MGIETGTPPPGAHPNLSRLREAVKQVKGDEGSETTAEGLAKELNKSPTVDINTLASHEGESKKTKFNAMGEIVPEKNQ